MAYKCAHCGKESPDLKGWVKAVIKFLGTYWFCSASCLSDTRDSQ